MPDYTTQLPLSAYTFPLLSDLPFFTYRLLNTQMRAYLSRKGHSLSLFHHWLLLARSDLQLSALILQWMLRFSTPGSLKATAPFRDTHWERLFSALPSFLYYFQMEAGLAACTQLSRDLCVFLRAVCWPLWERAFTSELKTLNLIPDVILFSAARYKTVDEVARASVCQCLTRTRASVQSWTCAPTSAPVWCSHLAHDTGARCKARGQIWPRRTVLFLPSMPIKCSVLQSVYCILSGDEATFDTFPPILEHYKSHFAQLFKIFQTFIPWTIYIYRRNFIRQELICFGGDLVDLR